MAASVALVGGTDVRVSRRSKTKKPARPKTIAEAAKSGSEKDTLMALRDRLAKAVDSDTTPARDLAALSKRLTDVMKDLKAFEQAESEEAVGGDVPDDAEFDPETV